MKWVEVENDVDFACSKDHATIVNMSCIPRFFAISRGKTPYHVEETPLALAAGGHADEMCRSTPIRPKY